MVINVTIIRVNILWSSIHGCFLTVGVERRWSCTEREKQSSRRRSPIKRIALLSLEPKIVSSVVKDGCRLLDECIFSGDKLRKSTVNNRLMCQLLSDFLKQR